MTLQEAFDKIYVGALTQMKRARIGPVDACALLDADGKSRCFIGMCMTPEQLTRAVESSNRIGFNPHLFMVGMCGLDHANGAELDVFIGSIVKIHDTVPAYAWRESLETLAKVLNLRVPEMPQPAAGAGDVQVPQGS